MQEALTLINHSAASAQERVENTKIILNAIPNSNWFLSSPKQILEEVNSGDAAIYDLLLHSQDRAYSIPELYAFTRSAGLEIMQLYPDDFTLGKKQYNPALYIKDERLLAEMRKLPLETQQQLAELMNGKIIKHTFHAVRKTVPLPSIENPEMVPFMRDTFQAFAYEDTRELIALSNDVVTFHPKEEPMAAHFPKTRHLGLFMKYFDGQRTMGELMQLVKNSITENKPSDQELLQEFSIFYNALNEYNWILLRHKDIPPYEYKIKMQERVFKMYA